MAFDARGASRHIGINILSQTEQVEVSSLDVLYVCTSWVTCLLRPVAQVENPFANRLRYDRFEHAMQNESPE